MPNQVSIISSLTIRGLQYFRDFSINFNHPHCILVGENGQGKTTILNILYGLLCRRWYYLSSCPFDSIKLQLGNGEIIQFSHAELDAFLFSTDQKATDQLKLDSAILEKFRMVEFILFEYLTEMKVLYLPVFRNIQKELKFLMRSFHAAPVRKEEIRQVRDEYFAIEEDLLVPDKVSSLLQVNGIPDDRIKMFVKSCNSYLVNTYLYLSETSLVLFTKRDKEPVLVDHLSTGEAQMIYMFSKIYLNKFHRLLILFDEPENSLSIRWQKRILLDLVNSQYCSFLFAITHSPFVFANELDRFASSINSYLSE